MNKKINALKRKISLVNRRNFISSFFGKSPKEQKVMTRLRREANFLALEYAGDALRFLGENDLVAAKNSLRNAAPHNVEFARLFNQWQK